MSKTMIITDTCCDLPASLVADYDVEILATTFNIDDRFFNEGIDFSPENFYEILPAPKDKIKSVSIPAAVYLDRFKNSASCGYKNVVVIMTGGDAFPMNRTVNEAYELFKSQNPTADLRIEIINTKSYSMGAGLIVLNAAKLAHEGADIEEILKQINDDIKRTTLIVDAFNIPLSLTDTTRPWKKLVQFSGSYHPYPTVKVNCEKAIELPIIKGDHTSFDQLLAYCVEAIRESDSDYALGYAARENEAKALAMLIEEQVGYPAVSVYKLGAISAYTASKAAITLCYKAPSIEKQLSK